MSRTHVPTLRSGHAYGSFQIRVLNANLQNFEVDWRARYRRIASLIRQQRPQIIGLQEIRVEYATSVDQLQELLNLLPKEYRYHHYQRGQVYSDVGQEEGVALVSTIPFENCSATLLSMQPGDNDRNQRVLLKAEFDVRALLGTPSPPWSRTSPPPKLGVFVAHFSYDEQVVQRHAVELAAEVDRFAAASHGPVLAMGDFNLRGSGLENRMWRFLLGDQTLPLRSASRTCFHDAWAALHSVAGPRAATFASWFPVNRADLVMFRDAPPSGPAGPQGVGGAPPRVRLAPTSARLLESADGAAAEKGIWDATLGPDSRSESLSGGQRTLDGAFGLERCAARGGGTVGSLRKALQSDNPEYLSDHRPILVDFDVTIAASHKTNSAGQEEATLTCNQINQEVLKRQYEMQRLLNKESTASRAETHAADNRTSQYLIIGSSPISVEWWARHQQYFLQGNWTIVALNNAWQIVYPYLQRHGEWIHGRDYATHGTLFPNQSEWQCFRFVAIDVFAETWMGCR